MCIINGNDTVYWLSTYFIGACRICQGSLGGLGELHSACYGQWRSKGGGRQLPPGVGRQNPTNEIIKIYYERNLEEKTERIK